MRRFDTVLANGESTVWCMPLVTITTPPVVSRSREQPIPSLTTHSMHPLPTYTHTHTQDFVHGRPIHVLEMSLSSVRPDISSKLPRFIITMNNMKQYV